ncbi:FKBP-type peptidyl-prolyl cis-trans isomerase 2 [Maribacter caenipelagi]|jgi:FKBP-type peptidyl-prolyl cis-trans isomerase 2|uniref:Peptidyl-prolyl cis-trans isomerase n=1 Tax=Maribacter caenipelagi TaxID=1447781 RepID=A0A4R7D3Y7_9FLAO|nr:peptidylprolyl isomerase [Maribacter caenipelagi]TDS15177.1 FKBP-type peptidyl-prolyl cis-trans isomerase 2 [Maribacter caenipelagi]|tara:strand:+ start:779 stop:1207 length:429 start_codon:yes stop_codon:yes gene_type:complete
MSKVKADSQVKVHYTGKLSNGQIFDSSVDREPLDVKLGQGSLIPGFEKGLLDMEANDKKTIVIAKEDAYGEKQKELFQTVQKSDLPQDMEPKVDMALMATNADGSERQLRVAEVNENDIVVDANHPLAGEDLTFELELVEVQ